MNAAIYRFLWFLLFIGLVVISIFLAKFHFNKEKFYQKKELNLDYSDKKEISENRFLFMDSVVRAAQYSNYKINKKRKRFLKTQEYFQKNKKLRGVSKHYFKKLIKEFAVSNVLLKDSASVARALNELDLKVQIVPVRLTLAQAILESAWGTSRFAKEGNAYFGIHCYTKACGMQFGSKNSKVYVKTYPSLTSSVEDYMHWLNTKKGPKNFRIARQVYFNSEKKDIIQLAEGLDSYSQIGGEYQKIIRDLMKNYIPDKIEEF